MTGVRLRVLLEPPQVLPLEPLPERQQALRLEPPLLEPQPGLLRVRRPERLRVLLPAQPQVLLLARLRVLQPGQPQARLPGQPRVLPQALLVLPQALPVQLLVLRALRLAVELT